MIHTKVKINKNGIEGYILYVTEILKGAIYNVRFQTSPSSGYHSEKMTSNDFELIKFGNYILV